MSAYLSSMRHAVQHPLLSWGAALTLWLMIAWGMFDHQSQLALQWVLPITGMILVWLVWEMYRGVVRYWALESHGERSYMSWLGLGFALLGGCALMLRLTGGLYSAFYPMFYLAVAFLASVGTARQGAYWFGYALFLEVAAVVASLGYHPNAIGRGALHIGFLGLFAGSHHIYLHGLLWDMRRLRNRKHNYGDMSERASLLEESQPSVGLTSASIQSLDSERQILFSLLREGLSAHGCALLWIDEADQTYEVMHIDTQTDDFELGPFSLQSGAPASLFQREDAVRISRSGDSGIHLPYYGRSVSVRAWMAVPLRQNNKVRGVLCADRIHRTPFSAREESMMEAVSIIFGSALESQRSFLDSRHEPQSLMHLYEAGQKLNHAYSEAELGHIALEQAHKFAPFDWGLISRYDPFEKTHTVLATTEEAAGLIQQTFPVEGSLLALSLKHGCPLPEKGILRSAAPLLATEDPVLPEYASLSIVPLRIRDEAKGCLVMASRDPQMFTDLEREKNLGTMAHHLAALLDNTGHQKYREELSELDSLTQLPNHRSLMETLQKRFETATEYNKRMSVLMIDIDHFQELNARFGYVTGDRVLIQVARSVQKMARDIDMVARYGGDEFILVLDETSRSNALRAADRLISRISQKEFCSEGDNPEIFSITLSVGVASFPDSSTELSSLLLGAEDACLQAKQRGGHRAMLHSSPDSGSAHQATPSVADLMTQPPPGWGWASSAPVPQGQQQNPGVLDHLSLLEAEKIGREPVSVSGILEAVVQSNRTPSQKDLVGIPDVDAIQAASDLTGLPEEPPYPGSESEESVHPDAEPETHFRQPEDARKQTGSSGEHDSTACLPEHMELLPSDSLPHMEPSPLDTPSPHHPEGYLPHLPVDGLEEPPSAPHPHKRDKNPEN